MQKYKQFIWRNTGELLYLSAQYSTPVVGFLVNLFIMKFVGPEILGVYQSIILWATYLSFLQLGVFNGLNRNLAYYKGAGMEDKLTEATSSGLVFSFIIALVALSLTISLFYSNINDHSKVAYWAFLMLMIVAFTNPITVFFDTLYRTGQDFQKLGKIISIENSVFTLLSFLIVIIGYTGFVMQNMIKTLLALFLRSSYKIRYIEIRISIKSIREQITTGFPIMLNGYLYSTFFIFDQFYIVRNFDRIELGYFSLARLVLFIVPIIPNSLTTVLYPKASAAFGRSGQNKSVLKPIFFKALLINTIVVIPVILIVYFSLEPLVKNFLPEYVDGIRYAKLSVIGGLGFILVGPSIILGVLQKNGLNFIVLALMSICSYGFYFLGLINFYNIESLIIFKNSLFIIYATVMLIFIYFQIRK